MLKIRDLYFLKLYILFGLLIYVLIYGILHYRPLFLVSKIWVVFGFFMVLTPLLYLLALQGLRKGGVDSVLVLLGSTVLRMLISMALALVFILKFRREALVFTADFFVLYILFAGFEIHCLLHKLRLPKKENNSSNK